MGREQTPVAPIRRTGDPLEGKLVGGKYKVLTPLSRGSMGMVYRAEQTPLGRVVALKMLDVRQDLGEGGFFEERFLKEASTLARLTHANTVRIFDYGIWEGRSFLVMEFVPGGTLSARLRGGRLPPPSPSTSPCRSPARCRRPTGSAWSTATSSRATSS